MLKEERDLSLPQKALVILAERAPFTVTADDISERYQLKNGTARKLLKGLEEGGFVASKRFKRTGMRGLGPNVFKVTAKGKRIASTIL